MATEKHDLTIAGHRISIRSAADRSYLQSVATLVEARIREAEGQGAGPQGALLLAALALAEELVRTRREPERLRHEVRVRTDELLSCLADAERA